MKILKLGMDNSDVLNVENAIRAMGFDGFEIDGMFDIHLENVIKYIQTNHKTSDGRKLDVDGVIGKDTYDVLDRLYQPHVNNFGASKSIVEAKPLVLDDTLPERLKHVHPILAEKTMQVIRLAKKDGLEFIVSQGLRTFVEQDKLYKQRPKVTNAKGGQSYHNYGIADDLAAVVNGKISWDEKLYNKIGAYAKKVGLEWGGNWKFVDKPHLQLPNMPGTRTLLNEYIRIGGGDRGIAAVWAKFVK